MRSITQVVEELNVSRNKIYSEIKRLDIQTVKRGRNNYIQDADFDRLKRIINSGNVPANHDAGPPVSERAKKVIRHDRDVYPRAAAFTGREYGDLKETIETLQEQLHKKDDQIQALMQTNYVLVNKFNVMLPSPVMNEVAVTAEPHEAKKSFVRKLKELFR